MMRTDPERISLRCGAGKVCITPPSVLLPRLYGLMNQRFGGVLDDIFVRVIALESRGKRMLLADFDLDKAPYPAEWMKELSERWNVPEEYILYTAIHTHTAPLTDPRPLDGPNAKARKTPDQQAATDEYECLVHDALFQAAEKAFDSMKPVRFGCSTAESYINVNRNVDYADGCFPGYNSTGDVDRKLTAAMFADEKGVPVAYMLNYAVHNAVMHRNTAADGMLGVSADLGGNICKKLEEENPGAVAVWTSGAAGDVNPVLMNEVCYPDPVSGKKVTAYISGDQILPLRILLGYHLEDVKKAISTIVPGQENPVLGGTVRWVYTPGKNGTEYAVRIHGLRIGPLVLCGFSGELYTSFGRLVQRLSPFPATAVINHDATFLSNAGYILDDDGLARGALGSRHSCLQPGYLAEAFQRELQTLFSELEDVE